ncbi:phage tail sheath family protein [Paenibacillus ginsengarvi]|uniref:phage tail sheath family protein n=1 Tax=Paenibacillus ginsengarvi TaxID=400777 RepID=UPI00308427FD
MTQNKVLPGVYINFTGKRQAVGAVGERGTMTMGLSMSWGTPKTVIEIHPGDDLSVTLGYDITASQLLLVREALKRAQTVLLYRLNSGTKATVTTGNLTATAKWGGIRGNDLSVVIQTNLDDEDLFDVHTLLSGEVVDTQTVAAIPGLVANDWVVWSGTGNLATTAGAPLVSGADGSVTNSDYSDYLSAIELYDFNTIAYPGTANDLKALYVAFAKRLRDDEGKKIHVVLENYTTADFEGVISVKNGVRLSDGTILTAAQATAWVAAATAGAAMNESLTYEAYDDAVDVGTRYTNSQLEAAVSAGEFVFVPAQEKAKVLVDINSFTSFEPTKGKMFSKNRVIRVLDGIGNDFKRIFESAYLGKVGNSADGRELLWGECAAYLRNLQNIGALQNVDPQTDLSVQQGTDSDSVYIEVNVQPIDSVEKIYMKVTVG